MTEYVLDSGSFEDTDYAMGRTNYEWLSLQADVLEPLTKRMLLAAGISSGMHVLDVGCGVGDVSFLLSALVGAEGSVIGVDVDARAVEIAEERRVAQGITNVAFRNSDARSIDVNRLFDAAVGRLVLMYMTDPTEALRLIAERVRDGGILAFHEWDARVAAASAANPVLARVFDLLRRTFECSGAHVGIGAELYWRMLDAGLEPEPSPLAEIAVHMGQDQLAYRRWALAVRAVLPKIVEYGLATEEDILDIVDHGLRNELLGARTSPPLSLLLIAQWARKPTS